MREITFLESLREALREEMKRDKSIFILGEDIQRGYANGVFGVTKGLVDEFGEERVRNTPISEIAIIGAAAGAAINGMRPIAEIMYADFICCCMEPVINIVAKLRYVHGGGKVKLPLVIRTATGAGIRASVCHSQSLEALFIHIPGLKIVFPSTPYDAKGLLKSSIRDDNPVLFFEHKLLYKLKGKVPEEEYLIPLGKADIKQEGEDLTIITYGIMVHKAIEASKEIIKEGKTIEIVDLRTLNPLDKETIIESVKKTGKAIIVEEGCKTGGVGAEILSLIVEEAFDYLDAPIKRVAAFDTPVPYSPVLEDFIIPDKKRIYDVIKSII
ncbi:MAG: alpha-ketoacid dehydrogenase subunit beta [Candidatus Bathyarchaeia archaeon]